MCFRLHTHSTVLLLYRIIEQLVFFSRLILYNTGQQRNALFPVIPAELNAMLKVTFLFLLQRDSRTV